LSKTYDNIKSVYTASEVSFGKNIQNNNPLRISKTQKSFSGKILKFIQEYSTEANANHEVKTEFTDQEAESLIWHYFPRTRKSDPSAKKTATTLSTLVKNTSWCTGSLDMASSQLEKGSFYIATIDGSPCIAIHCSDKRILELRGNGDNGDQKLAPNLTEALKVKLLEIEAGNNAIDIKYELEKASICEKFDRLYLKLKTDEFFLKEEIIEFIKILKSGFDHFGNTPYSESGLDEIIERVQVPDNIAIVESKVTEKTKIFIGDLEVVIYETNDGKYSQIEEIYGKLKILFPEYPESIKSEDDWDEGEFDEVQETIQEKLLKLLPGLKSLGTLVFCAQEDKLYQFEFQIFPNLIRLDRAKLHRSSQSVYLNIPNLLIVGEIPEVSFILPSVEEVASLSSSQTCPRTIKKIGRLELTNKNSSLTNYFKQLTNFPKIDNLVTVNISDIGDYIGSGNALYSATLIVATKDTLNQNPLPTREELENLLDLSSRYSFQAHFNLNNCSYPITSSEDVENILTKFDTETVERADKMAQATLLNDQKSSILTSLDAFYISLSAEQIQFISNESEQQDKWGREVAYLMNLKGINFDLYHSCIRAGRPTNLSNYSNVRFTGEPSDTDQVLVARTSTGIPKNLINLKVVITGENLELKTSKHINLQSLEHYYGALMKIEAKNTNLPNLRSVYGNLELTEIGNDSFNLEKLEEVSGEIYLSQHASDKIKLLVEKIKPNGIGVNFV